MKKQTATKILAIVERVRNQLIWKTAYGRENIVADMNKEHIENTIIFLHKRIEDFKKYKLGTPHINELSCEEWLEVFRDELKYRNTHNL